MLVQVQSSPPLRQYSCGVKIRLYSKGVLHHWMYFSVGIGSESLGCAQNKLHFISIGGSAMTAIFFLVHHRMNCG